MSVNADPSAMSGSELDLRIWGKSKGLGERRYPLACHLLDAAAAACLLWERYVPAGVRTVIGAGLGVSEDHAGALAALWAGLHDIGKITPEFQACAPGARLPGYPPALGQRVRHDQAGHDWCQAMLPHLGYAGCDPVLVAQLVGGHHGTFHRVMPGVAPGAPLVCFGFSEDAWEGQRRAAFAVMGEVLGSPGPPPRLEPEAGMLVCALIILADWLVSQESHLRSRLGEVPRRGSVEEMRAHFGRSLTAASVLVQEAGLGRLELRPGSFSESFPHIAEPNALQHSIAGRLAGLAAGPGLLLVMAPPGVGKTEAGLYAAQVMGMVTGRPGLYVALPTMATADQMFDRVLGYARARAAAGAPLMLLHSMAWLNTRYTGEEAAEGQVLTGDDGVDEGFAPTDWLLGRRRGMCAPWAVGTIDQALMAVLTSRYNVLRMFGLAGKTVIVDEVHACDPYMQGLLRQLLRWLGRLGTPVVLLSATVTGPAARQLITAYLEGALGRGRAAGRAEQAEVHYPGWIYADAVDGVVTGVPVRAPARRPLRVDLREIPGRTAGGAGAAVPDRQAALRAELAGVVAGGGCALVICTTVDEAQQAFCQLRDWFGELRAVGADPPVLDLLHARFPMRQRGEITGRVMDRYGKKGHRGGTRPPAAVLVATAIVEQSLDLDFDVVISDLAPVALLLQRAGRCWRHEDLGVITRPGWAAGPRLVVLVPPGGPAGPRLFRSWTAVYDEVLLARTVRLLASRDEIPIPGDVQGLVDAVYYPPDGAGPDLITGLERAETARLGAEIAELAMSSLVSVPPPWDLDSLCKLTDSDVDPDLLATRFDADSVRVLPVFADDTGRAWLDPGREIPVPGTGRDRPTPAECRAVIERTIPVRGGSWVKRDRRGADSDPPGSWARNPYLRPLVLLPHRVRGDGVIEPARVGGREFLLDGTLGICMSPVI
jgi:CRISPR-associated endonuclease/helicase Cas3